MPGSEGTPTSPQPDTDRLREELKVVEEEIVGLRRQVRELRTQLNDLGPTDAEDRSVIITQAEELESFIVPLEAHRESLMQKLGQQPT